MNPENTKTLFEKYPKIFAQKDLDMTKTAMCWGFECGDGWYWLIDNLCNTIQEFIDHNKHLNIPQVEAVQVKEKFGTLSFYITGGNELVGGMIWLAESLSSDICDRCGSTQNVTQTRGWIKTVCKKCLKEY